MKQAMQVLTSKETVDWYTPREYTDMAREVLGGIDLDPASNPVAQGWINAATYYALDLSQFYADSAWKAEKLQLELARESRRQLDRQPAWRGRVWLNPPFSDTAAWVRRLSAEYDAGHVSAAVLLVNSNLGYSWYEELWARCWCCCMRERMRFITIEHGQPVQGGQAKRGQTFAYYGPEPERFDRVFRIIGRILPPGGELPVSALDLPLFQEV